MYNFNFLEYKLNAWRNKLKSHLKKAISKFSVFAINSKMTSIIHFNI